MRRYPETYSTPGVRRSFNVPSGDPTNGKTMTRSPLRLALGLGAAALLLSTILLANWVTTDYGFIPVGFGFMATAGTIFAGITLASRDLVQDTLGKRAVLVLILVGTVLSFLYAEPMIAVASAVAFGLSELLDFAVYTPLRSKAKVGDKRWALAVVLSNIVGAAVDTVVFLGVAFGAAAILPALPGQMVGKLWATLAYLVLGALGALAYRRWVRPRVLAGR